MKKTTLISFLVGFIFSIGLGISGMTQPQKVIGFLSFFYDWNPALVFVMGGAVSVHMITYYFIHKREHPLFEGAWQFSSRNDITRNLVVGSAIFGIGWGLGGYCPGPAVTSLASLQKEPFVFVAMMFFGMFLFSKFDNLEAKIKEKSKSK